MRHYSKDVHVFCASKGFAPILNGFQKLPGGWWMVVMETIIAGCRVRTIVEIKSGAVDESECQTATYAGDVHQSPPDLVGAYGLYASSQDYSIHWSDCTSAYASRFQWSNLDPSSNLLNPYTDRPMGITVTRPSRLTCLMPRANSCQMTHIGVLPFFLALSV